MQDPMERPNYTCINMDRFILFQPGSCLPDIRAGDENGRGSRQHDLLPDYPDRLVQLLEVGLPCSDHGSLRCQGGCV